MENQLSRWAWVKLKRWLRNEPKTELDYLFCGWYCLLANFAWLTVVSIALAIWFLINPAHPMPGELPAIPSLWILFPAAFLEEIIFRWAPLMPALLILRKKRLYILLWISLYSSVIFGLVHGSFYNIFIQGVMGMIYCLFFIRCSRVRPRPGAQFAALIVTTLAHAFYNIIIILTISVANRAPS